EAVKKPSGPPDKGKAAAATQVPEKAKLVIKTPGPFFYDLQKDFARFDIPTKKGQFPEQVLVTRVNPPPPNTDAPPKQDHLICDHLELQFRKKETDASAASRPAADRTAAKQNSPTDRTGNLEVEMAHATGSSVALTSEGEFLEAFGDDFSYDART